jgi:transcriptional regulator
VHIPHHFNETRREVLERAIEGHPLATLVTVGRRGIDANHLPLEFDARVGASGALRGHVSRNNPVWRDTDPAHEALAIFQGPQAYISPAWYPSKEEHGRVVPTWNYVVIHARGRLRFVEDAEWLRAHVTRLTDRIEGQGLGAWHVSDAPADFIDGLLRGIVGFEMEITSLVGKWKTSQNRTADDRAGVVRGLRAQGNGAMAALVESGE